MSPKILTAAHAEDVGGYVVEPGGEIPAEADTDTVKRLEGEGKVATSKAASTTKKEA